MIDTIAIIASEHIERMSMNNADRSFLLLEDGRKTEATAVSSHLGGGAANTAVALARLGFDTEIMARIGIDQRGGQVIAALEEAGVGTGRIVEDDMHPTGASAMVASHDRNASTFTFRGANTQLHQDDLTADMFKVDLLHICALSNASAEIFPDLIFRGRAAGASISANIGIRQLASRGREILDLLPEIDVFFFNRAEAEAFMPVFAPQFLKEKPIADKRAGELVLTNGGFDTTLTALFRAMRDVTDSVIVMTDGHCGAYVFEKSVVRYFPAVPAEVAGTAGAGDAFASTFSAYLTEGQPIEAAAYAAALNAASVISHVDTQTGLLDVAGLKTHTPAKDWLARTSEWET